jgi:hypothetical protein
MTLTFFRILIVLVLGTVITEGSSKNESEISIVPKPLSLKRDDGSFLVTKTTTVLYGGHAEVQRVAEEFASRLRKTTGYPIVVAPLSTGSKLEDAIVIYQNLPAVSFFKAGP